MAHRDDLALDGTHTPRCPATAIVSQSSIGFSAEGSARQTLRLAGLLAQEAGALSRFRSKLIRRVGEKDWVLRRTFSTTKVKVCETKANSRALRTSSPESTGTLEFAVFCLPYPMFASASKLTGR